MKKLVLTTGIFCLLLILSTPAWAITLVNTVQPPANDTGRGIHQTQWLAAEFSLAQPYILTDILGWMGSYNDGAPVTLAIYGDGGEIPNVNDQLFVDTFYVPASDGIPDWHGLSGLDWSLMSGTYWVAFEIYGEIPFAYMPYVSPSPQDNEAYSYMSAAAGQMVYTPYDLGLGIIIEGDQPVIPEPATIVLLGSSFLGFLGYRRRNI